MLQLLKKEFQGKLDLAVAFTKKPKERKAEINHYLAQRNYRVDP